MSWLADLILGIVKWLFGQRQQAEGEALGKAEQQVQDITRELKNEADAQAARTRVAARGLSVVTTDSDNAGPQT